jgi:hypothetical protein
MKFASLVVGAGWSSGVWWIKVAGGMRRKVESGDFMEFWQASSRWAKLAGFVMTL